VPRSELGFVLVAIPFSGARARAAKYAFLRFVHFDLCEGIGNPSDRGRNASYDSAQNHVAPTSR
jgi:hypothetical protein